MPTIKELRPKKLYDKTVFIELEMEKSYSNKNFYKVVITQFLYIWYGQKKPLL